MQKRRDNPAPANIPVTKKACRSVTFVFIVDSLRFSILHRLVRSIPFQCLNARFFVCRNRVNTFAFVFCGRGIRFTNLFDLTLKLLLIFYLDVEPISTTMGRQVVFFSIFRIDDIEIVSTMLRWSDSSTKSFDVQCVTGRPHCSGDSSDRAAIFVRCSELIVSFRPRPFRSESQAKSKVSFIVGRSVWSECFQAL